MLKCRHSALFAAVVGLTHGSDGAVAGHGPREYWAASKTLPLTPAELNAIATNVTPYLR